MERHSQAVMIKPASTNAGTNPADIVRLSIMAPVATPNPIIGQRRRQRSDAVRAHRASDRNAATPRLFWNERDDTTIAGMQSTPKPAITAAQLPAIRRVMPVAPTATKTANCSPAYPTVCIPPASPEFTERGPTTRNGIASTGTSGPLPWPVTAWLNGLRPVKSSR